MFVKTGDGPNGPTGQMQNRAAACWQGCKHIHGEAGPANKIYLFGGDGSTAENSDGSYNNHTWSYTWDTNTWTLEHGWCAGSGEVQPGRPDESGFVWDKTRNRFWVMPRIDTWNGVPHAPGSCSVSLPTATTTVGNPLLTTISAEAGLDRQAG